MNSKFPVLLKRGVRTFIAVIGAAYVTAIGAVTIELAKGHSISTFNDLKQLGISVIPIFCIAFLGALGAAIEKGVRWQDPEQPIPVTEPVNETNAETSTGKSKTQKS